MIVKFRKSELDHFSSTPPIALAIAVAWGTMGLITRRRLLRERREDS